MINRFGVGWKETAAAASKRPNVLQPRDHQAALSLYRDRGEKWGIAQFGKEEGLVRPPARVTDPAVVYSYCTGNRCLSSIQRCVNSLILSSSNIESREERAVDGNAMSYAARPRQTRAAPRKGHRKMGESGECHTNQYGFQYWVILYETTKRNQAAEELTG